MGVEPGPIDVRDLGHRWGSLGKQHRLNFHWATIQLRPALVDYVIVHELAHIHEPNHSPRFWGRVERAMPNFQLAKEELARSGSGLWLGGRQGVSSRARTGRIVVIEKPPDATSAASTATSRCAEQANEASAEAT